MTNTQIINKFYKAFEKGDSKKMNSCLSHNIKFDDPALGKAKGDKVKFWWQFLCENAVDFSIDLIEVKADSEKGIAVWKNSYTFKETGKPVTLDIVSKFYFENNLIIKHIDEYDIKSFIKQAFGSTAGIFGGSFLVKKTVRAQSKILLKKYMKKSKLL